MAACENSTGIDYWLSIPAKDIHVWLELLTEQQEEIRRRLKSK